MDVEWAHAVAPQANLILFEANSASDQDLISTAVNTARNTPGVAAVTMSFGGSDYSGETALDSVFTTPTGHTGVTFLASTGDGGEPGGYPAFSPNVVAVGGTTLTINSSTYAWVNEVGWSGSGGGKSAYESEPSYQSGVQSSGWREIPDVSFDADPASGVAVYDSYDFGSSSPWVQVGGTSLSSPCWAGLVAIGDQLRVAEDLAPMDGPSQTLPMLYSMKAGDFHDIIAGNNGFAAGPGYDLVTGIGSPVSNNLLTDFVPSTPRGVVALSAHTYQIGATVGINVYDSNTSTCTVTLISSAGDAETVSLSEQATGIFGTSITTSSAAATQGDGVLQTLPGGTITVYYNDADDGTGHSAVATDQATTYASLQLTTTGPLPTASQGSPYSTTLLASGGVGPYTWSAPGLGNYVENSPASGWLGGGTAQGWHADDESWSLALPFSFPYYGKNYNSVWVCSNGFLDFASSAPAYANSDAALEASVRIAPLWEDLTTTTAGDDIFVTSNSSYIAVRWAAHTVSGSNPVNVEAVLYPNGDVKFNYGPTVAAVTPTIGVSAGDKLRYTLSSRDGASSIAPSVTSLMAHPLSGLSLSPAGVLSGTPTIAGAYDTAFTVTDSATPANSVTSILHLDVAALPPLTVTIPASATKGNAPKTGTVSIPAALGFSLVVNLSSSNTAEAAVPVSCTIAPGHTSATFAITIANNTNLDGVQPAVITAAASGYVSASGTLNVHDSQPATLTVRVPLSMDENTEAPQLAGTVKASQAPTSDITVQLVSSDPTGLTVPPTVVLHAGTTTANFYLTMHDDHVINDYRPITVTASIPDWTSGAAATVDLDDDGTIEVLLPASTWEGQGVQHNAGTVQLGGIVPVTSMPLVVTLTSSNTTDLTVQTTVTIAPGQSSAPFDFTAPQNGLYQGPVSVQVTAAARALAPSSTSIQVLDDNVDHFVFDSVSSPQTVDVPFFVTARAVDVLNNPILVYRGSATLTGAYESGSAAIPPTTVNFSGGKWMGSVTVAALDPAVTLHVDNGAGSAGSSNAFAIQPGSVASYHWSTIASPQSQGVSFPATVTALDANGFTVTGFTGSVSLTGLVRNTSGRAGQILLYDDSADHYFQTALTALGMSFTVYTDDYYFETALASANPHTTLALVDDEDYGYSFENIPAFVNNGGAVVFASWILWDLPSVAAALGAEAVSAYYNPMPVYDWGGSSLFSGLTSPVGFEQTIYGYNGEYLQPAGSGVAVAGFQATPAADQAAVIIGSAGRTIVNGFQMDNAVSATAAVQLAENEIQSAINNMSVPVYVTPNAVTFTGGTWSGNLTAWPQTDSMFVLASDSRGNAGYSNTFTVTGFPSPLTLVVPANATDGQGTVPGAVDIPAALDFPLTVSLVSSDGSRVSVPATVTIPAGQTSAPLPITIVDSTLLDGLEPVLISATAPGYTATSGTITVHDNETATLTVSMPASAHETAGTLSGTVTSSVAPTRDITVQLVSSDPTGLTVPATVILHAGTTTASFYLAMHDDHVIEGNRAITVTASVENWTSGSATVTDLDDDGTLAVTLPASGWEGQVVSGKVQLGGTLASDLVVPLTSGEPTGLSVPSTVTIPAGQTSATFNVTLLDDNRREGPRTVQVTAATALGSNLAVQNGSMTVDDSDVDHFTFSAISGAPIAGVSFPVTIHAYDVQNDVITTFNGSVKLTAFGQSGPLSITPTSITFSSGAWSGNVTINAPDPSVQLQVTNGAGATGTSSSLSVSQFQITTPSPLPPASLSQPYSVTLAAAGGVGSYTWSAGNYTRSTVPSGWLGGGTAQGWHADNQTWMLALPWSFPYFGGYNAVVWVGSNGYLNLANSSVSVSGTDSTLAAGVLIAPLWEDLTTTTAGDDIFVTSNSNYVAVRWAAHTVSGSHPVNVEAVLFANGNIEFNYGSSAYANSPEIGVSLGDSAHYTLSAYDHASSIPPNVSELYVPSSLPTGLTLSSAGVLSGTPTVAGGYDMSITATDSASPLHSVTSTLHLDVVTNPLLLTVPANATEGAGTVSGTVSVPTAPTSDLTVSLTSRDTARVTVPASVTIAAGQTSAPVPITIVNTTLLDGLEPVLISATAPGYTATSGTITVHDNETATLTVSMPASAHEAGGELAGAGTITCSQAPARDITVQLTSSNMGRLLVPTTVVIPAGQTMATFSLDPIDDHVIEAAPAPVTVTAHVENWTDGMATMNMLDDDATMSVTLPASVTEGQSAQTGTVRIGGTTTSAVVITLVSSNTTEVTVPTSVTIAPGSTSATFLVTPVSNNRSEGQQCVQVSATRRRLPHGRRKCRGDGQRPRPFRFYRPQRRENGRRALHRNHPRLRRSGQHDRYLRWHRLAFRLWPKWPADDHPHIDQVYFR